MKINQLNSIALIFLGVYLIAVVFHGNSNSLIGLVEKQKDFLKWGAALFILLFIGAVYKNKLTNALILLVIVAMVLTSTQNDLLKNFSEQFNQIFKA